MNNRKLAGGAISMDGNDSSPSSPSSSSPLSAPKQRNSKKPKYSRFTQQELPACKPILTPASVITFFILIAVIFIPIGLASLFASDRLVELVDRYDQACLLDKYPTTKQQDDFIRNSTIDKKCNRTFIVPKHMKAPVFVYYQLDNFYQNHRRYVKSRSDKQLRSTTGVSDTDSCKPEADVGGDPIVPCGLIAWSLFNDTYAFSINQTRVEVNRKNIAWKSDRTHKFGSNVYPQNFQTQGPKHEIGGGKLNSTIALSEQEDLIVWMRTAAFPTFRKLYGRIETDLAANTKITVVIENNYNTYKFGGKKKLVLSTTSWIGGKNDFLGIAYLTIGGLCLFLAIAFILVYVFRPRPLGDPSYLSWNKNPTTQLY